MPGHYIHHAASHKETRKNRSFILGVEMPDLLKSWYRNYGLEGARTKYNKIKTEDMPNFSYFEDRIQQIENNEEKSGLHYGWSSNPDILLFWNSLTKEEQDNPFFKGYLWHLLTDLVVYKVIDIDSIYKNCIEKYKGSIPIREIVQIEQEKIHKDWDIINAIIRNNHQDIILPEEIIELNEVQYIYDEPTNYIDARVIQFLIDYLNQFNPLEDNLEDIINEIRKELPEKEKENKVNKK